MFLSCFHTVWLHVGNLSDLIASIQGRINCNPDVAEKIIVMRLITMISYVFQAANHCKSVIRVLSDDSDVFGLLGASGLQCKVQMER